MKSILKRALPLLLLMLSSFASAQTLIGTATVYDPTGYQVATNTTGQSDSDTLGLNVSDYAAPVANVIFTDQRDGSEISAITENNMYFVVPNVSVTDVCDPAPQVSAVADTVSQVTEGFVMKIQGNNGSVSMPSSGVELRTTATDASGNTATQSFILPINNQASSRHRVQKKR